MIEKEVNIRNINKKDVRSKLRKLKANLLFKGWQTNQLFDFKDKRLWKKKFKECVRVRAEGKDVIVNFWSQLPSKSIIKLRWHSEFVTKNKKEVIDFLNKLGLYEFTRLNRSVERYKYKNIIFEIKRNSIGELILEIEADSKRKIFEGIKIMGFSKKDINW